MPWVTEWITASSLRRSSSRTRRRAVVTSCMALKAPDRATPSRTGPPRTGVARAPPATVARPAVTSVRGRSTARASQRAAPRASAQAPASSTASAPRRRSTALTTPSVSWPTKRVAITGGWLGLAFGPGRSAPGSPPGGVGRGVAREGMEVQLRTGSEAATKRCSPIWCTGSTGARRCAGGRTLGGWKRARTSREPAIRASDLTTATSSPVRSASSCIRASL